MAGTTERSVFLSQMAPELASQAVGHPLPMWRGPLRMSRKVGFFGDDDILVIVAAPSESQNDADGALAWGLAYAGDRDLALVLPSSLAGPSLNRLPWVSVSVRMFTFDQDLTVEEQVLPSRAEVLDNVRAWGMREPKPAFELSGQRAAWVRLLEEWATSHPMLEQAHRPGYLAWHYRGRQVLRIRPTGLGFEVLAGVRYSSAHGEHPVPLPTLLVEDRLSESALASVVGAVEEAVDRRLTGADSDDQEHWFQDALSREISQLGLDPDRLKREFPAFRPIKRPGSIDFLGVDRRNGLHVVETKLGNDLMLALQGLDYWIYVTANAENIAGHLGADPNRRVTIDFVCGSPSSGAEALGPYTPSQLEGIDGGIPWQFHLAGPEWQEHLALSTTPLRHRPQTTGPYIIEPRYDKRLQAHLVEHEAKSIRTDPPLYLESGGGILAGARILWDDLAERGRLHRFANHVRSSQAFAINLFGNLDRESIRARLQAAGIDVDHVTDPILEFEEESDLLGEATRVSPHQTQIDVLLQCQGADGSRILVAIEVKLAERDFSHCSGFQSDRNDRRDVCAQGSAFGGNKDACFLLRNYGRGTRRRYDLYLAPVEDSHAGCPFRLSLSQPMRTVALLRAMIEDGQVDKGFYALTAPLANESIWRRWAEAKTAFERSAIELVDLPADSLIAYMPEEPAATLRSRYQL